MFHPRSIQKIISGSLRATPRHVQSLHATPICLPPHRAGSHKMSACSIDKSRISIQKFTALQTRSFTRVTEPKLLQVTNKKPAVAVSTVPTGLDMPTFLGMPFTKPSAVPRPPNSLEDVSFAMTPINPYEGRDLWWQKIPMWKDVTAKEFLSYRWGTKNLIQGKPKFFAFLRAVLPDTIAGKKAGTTETKEDLMADILEGITSATMAVRMTPYILSRIDWTNPRADPVFRQFVPTKSTMLQDHPKLALDSLHEKADSPVEGLVHRYTDKALFLPTSVCPTYCMYCTRSYAVGADTDSVNKASLKPSRKRWEAVFDYIERTPVLQDIVVSGGDSYYLAPEHIAMIGERLISIPHIRRFRFASKGLAVSPNRIIDDSDGWAQTLISVAKKARKAGKHMALHTHFNHPNEVSWLTELAAQRLHEEGVIVRNQSVLLRGVNDNVDIMGKLIRKLSDMNIFPYYVYQCDMVEKVEHLRTPLRTILDIESKLRGSIAGFLMPQFVVDLPGGGGKRLASTFSEYDPVTGRSAYTAPAVTGHNKKDRVYEYWDPLYSLPKKE